MRVSHDRHLAGVARGLSEHLGVDVLMVRLLFVVLAFANGAGFLMYAAFWIFAPLQVSGDDVADPGRVWRERDLGMLLALGSLALGGALLLSALGVGLHPGLAVPLVVIGVGVVILWRQADDAQRERWRAATGTRRVPDAVRAGLGIALVLIGGGAILIGPADLNGTSGGLVAALVVTAGLALVTGPWWARMVRELNAERSARIREQERAEVAAHVHDSVLHTLTLIQRHVDNPREVARLARAQERELRGWLYRPRRDPEATVTSEVERVAAEVEDAHGVAIDVVVVGDAPLDDSLSALLHATRECLVNAAKYARDSPISVYAEVEPEQVTVFVRDRGPGFDPAAVPEDRLGLRQSVLGRMKRHGGAATVRSADGEGTEVQLEMPRSPS
jgi:phage shock protein PspC (stress-responsive transcriptional regulator)